MKISGGYVVTRRPLMRAGFHAHTTELETPVSELDLRALNAVQATPWRINRWVLDVMQQAWRQGSRLGGLEVGEPLTVPPRMEDAQWAATAPDDRAQHKATRGRIHALNASIEGRSRAVLSALSVAEEMRSLPSIWFPHVKDFRHRIYPAAVHGPQPQGNDISKSLLMFADGQPLGEDGMFWLCVRAAGCAGQDKLPLADRVGWVMERRGLIEAAAADPFGNPWWADLDEPWGFLATCHELAAAFGDPEGFVSHLPIPLDGSCNGLQHLSAMGLDPIGSRATNLCAGQDRQDVYQEVANRVNALVEADVVAGLDVAREWHGRVTRKVVKRAVMTTAYGVTDRGIRDQLIADGHVADGFGETGAAADYLKDKLVQALDGTVASARSIMAWLQTCADRLAKAGKPFTWTTPSGSQVRQGYRVLTGTRVVTLTGKVTMMVEEPGAALNPRKQALGSAPNVIHSFDAAHLSMTVAACHDAGISSFAMIHDSYGTHARNTTKLNAHLRATFVEIYREDWLAKLAAEMREAAPGIDLPAPPARGAFDVQEVHDAAFFFS